MNHFTNIDIDKVVCVCINDQFYMLDHIDVTWVLHVSSVVNQRVFVFEMEAYKPAVVLLTHAYLLTTVLFR